MFARQGRGFPCSFADGGPGRDLHPQRAQGGRQGLRLHGPIGLLFHLAAIVPTGLGVLTQVALTARRNEGTSGIGNLGAIGRVGALPIQGETLVDQRDESAIEGIDPSVVEVSSAGSVDRHLFRLAVEELTISLHLLTHVPESILAATARVFIDRHQVGVIQHVNLFELARGPEFGGHHI